MILDTRPFAQNDRLNMDCIFRTTENNEPVLMNCLFKDDHSFMALNALIGKPL